jgi:hypothetical protein
MEGCYEEILVAIFEFETECIFPNSFTALN